MKARRISGITAVLLVLALACGTGLSGAPAFRKTARLQAASAAFAQREASVDAGLPGTDGDALPATEAQTEIQTEIQTEARSEIQTVTRTAARTEAAPASEPEPQTGETAPTEASRVSAVRKTTAIRPGQDYPDRLVTGEDEHWYTFTVARRSALKLTLKTEKEDFLGSRVLTLYQVYYKNGVDGETALRPLTTLHAFSADGEASTPVVGVNPGEYRALVTSGEVTALGRYALRLEQEARTDYEIEYNDAITRYTELTSGVQLRGSACYREDGPDLDWYLYRMYHDGTLEVKFRHAAQKQTTAAYKVTLYDRDMRVLYTGISTMDTDTLKSGSLGVRAGVYFVCVESRVYYAGDYGLTLTGVTNRAAETELNDAPESATAIAAGTPVTAALTARDGRADVDWFRGSLSAPGLVTVTLEAEADEEEDVGAGRDDAAKPIFRLTVLDAAGTPVYTAVSVNTAPGIRTPALGLPAGDFYIRTDQNGLYADKREYRLTYTAEAAACETEANDAPAAADPLAFNAALTGTVADGDAPDADCFTFTLPAAKTVTLTLTHDSAQAADREIYDLRLLDAAGNAMPDAGGRAARSVTAGEKSSAARYALPAGTYTVVLTAGLFADAGRYALLLTE